MEPFPKAETGFNGAVKSETKTMPSHCEALTLGFRVWGFRVFGFRGLGVCDLGASGLVLWGLLNFLPV